MKKDSKESIRRQISHYTAKHGRLADDLVAEESRRIPNATKIRQIKKLKLMCKDKLTDLSERLAALQKPPKPSAEVISLPFPQPAATTVSPRRAASG